MLARDASDEGRDLIARARAGERAARAALLERWQPRILARIRVILGEGARRHAESSDYVQSVLIQALERLDEASFADEQHVLRWMTAVARNDIRDQADKRRERALESLSESWHASGHADANTPSPPSAADREERFERLVECLEVLAESERAVIELRDFEGLTFQEVGARLGWSDDRARLAHMRAMARLGRLVARSAP